MAKRFFNMITIVLVAFAISFGFTSCQKDDILADLEMYERQHPNNDDKENNDNTDNNTNDEDDNTGDDNDDNDDNTGNGDDNGDDNTGDDNTGNDDDNNTGNGDDNGNDNGNDEGNDNGNDEGTTPPADNRETPHWLGKAGDAVYTRVIKSTNTTVRFEDMLMFRYENGCVLVPNGNKKAAIYFAYSQATANAQGVQYAPKGVNTAYWTGTQWYAAALTIQTPNWAYDTHMAGKSLVIHQNDATAHGIGVDVSPKPKAQSYKVSNGTITITYAVNNGSTTATTPLSLK